MTDALITALGALVGAAQVLADPDLRAGHETDWTGRWTGRALAVVRPGSTEEVAAVVQACSAAGVALIPQGGNTGLVGGSVPRTALDQLQVVLSTRRLAEVGDLDAVAGEVTIGAGVVLGTLQALLAPAGWQVGVDLGARDSATIGGMVATNAGGLHVLRHGTMRAQVLGLEAVLADGSVVRRLPGMVKDNTGLHLPSLLAGSEGTLAVITRVRLRLVPLRPRAAVALVGVESTAEASALLAGLRRTLDSLTAAELFFDDGLELVLRHAGGASPLERRHPAYLLVECAADADPTPPLAEALGAGRDAALAADPAGRARLWRLREAHTEAINAEGVPHKLDVAVPVDRLDAFVRESRDAVQRAAPGARTYLYGHLGEGNLHLGIIGPPPEDEAVDDAVLRLAIAMGGTISAEHGVGIAKTGWLERDRGAADVAAMRAVKRALDPDWMLNPGVLLPMATRVDKPA